MRLNPNKSSLQHDSFIVDICAERDLIERNASLKHFFQGRILFSNRWRKDILAFKSLPALNFASLYSGYLSLYV